MFEPERQLYIKLLINQLTYEYNAVKNMKVREFFFKAGWNFYVLREFFRVNRIRYNKIRLNKAYTKFFVSIENEAEADKYIVQKGETLSQIAKRNGCSYSYLAKINGIDNPNKIFEGQEIVLPKIEPTVNDIFEYIIFEKE